MPLYAQAKRFLYRSLLFRAWHIIQLMCVHRQSYALRLLRKLAHPLPCGIYPFRYNFKEVIQS